MFTLPVFVISCNHKCLNSRCRCFPSHLLDAIALAPLESVQTRACALKPKSINTDCIPRASSSASPLFRSSSSSSYLRLSYSRQESIFCSMRSTSNYDPGCSMRLSCLFCYTTPRLGCPLEYRYVGHTKNGQTPQSTHSRQGTSLRLGSAERDADAECPLSARVTTCRLRDVFVPMSTGPFARPPVCTR